MSRPLRVAVGLAVIAAALGTAVAFHYARAGLTLAHYDAKAHLVVSRRILDSLTPGYQQIGAVWLPLPHLLNAVFVQYDPWFRSGVSAVAISVASFGLAVFAAAALVGRATRSASAACVAAGGIALNPNLLYLQSTPMTEPLLLATSLVAVWLVWEFVSARVCGATLQGRLGGEAEASHHIQGDGDTKASRPARNAALLAGVALALACLTRYEAWPIAVAALGAAWFAIWRHGVRAREALIHVRAVAIWPAAAIVGFLIHSRITIGEWFARDFYTPDNLARHDASLTTAQIWWGVEHLSGPLVAIAMTAGVFLVLGLALFSRTRASWLLLLAPLASAAVPWLAFYSGHPYRIRYMIPVAAAGAIPMAAMAALGPRRWRLAAALALAAIAAFELRPLDARAPMVAEAQWDRPNGRARQRVTGCLAGAFRPGEKIMASMGSLAHFMQETAAAGYTLNDFLHEGNGDIWLQAIVAPRPYVEWILIQEYAEGGDMLARLARSNPNFLEGYDRVCDGGGVVLYRRRQPRT